ncbi:MAG: AMP-binding protein, partial [Bdellovibrionaceae bacterium]|nr:AMP-binding protein [Pseudobdellovibrionaceae bacterium]
MKTSFLLHHLIFQTLQNHPTNVALKDKELKMTYKELALKVISLGQYLLSERIINQQRVAIFLEKRFEFVISCFAASCSGNMFIPINPILKQDQVFHILQDSGSKVLITSIQRIEPLLSSLKKLSGLSKIILTDSTIEDIKRLTLAHKEIFEKISLSSWNETELYEIPTNIAPLNTEFSLVPQIDIDAVSIFYTSGSTGKPKGVVLSHRNMIFGAKNVASYLNNTNEDIILAALPLSFDAGFSQITTAFHVGATVILLNYILPNDILSVVTKEKVTGLTAVPPLWIQISNLNWPESVTEHLKYLANTGGKMPAEILKRLRSAFPKTKPYLMYGLTESFRSTYLPPEEIDKRPHSIGKAIPNAEILVLKPDGSHCKPREPGELVHRGALVGLGYWNDPEKTAERYKIMPSNSSSRPNQIMIPEVVVYSGD